MAGIAYLDLSGNMEPAHFQTRSSLEKGKITWTDADGVPGETPTPYAQSSSSEDDDDARLLARIGYKQVCLGPRWRNFIVDFSQELRREFTKWSTVSYAISILGVLGSQPATYGVPITVGGPATAVWAWFIGSVMAYIIATSGTHASI